MQKIKKNLQKKSDKLLHFPILGSFFHNPYFNFIMLVKTQTEEDISINTINETVQER